MEVLEHYFDTFLSLKSLIDIGSAFSGNLAITKKKIWHDTSWALA
jgi:hypothetical protein